MCVGLHIGQLWCGRSQSSPTRHGRSHMQGARTNRTCARTWSVHCVCVGLVMVNSLQECRTHSPCGWSRSTDAAGDDGGWRSSVWRTLMVVGHQPLWCARPPPHTLHSVNPPQFDPPTHPLHTPWQDAHKWAPPPPRHPRLRTPSACAAPHVPTHSRTPHAPRTPDTPRTNTRTAPTRLTHLGVALAQLPGLCIPPAPLQEHAMDDEAVRPVLAGLRCRLPHVHRAHLKVVAHLQA